MEYEGRAMSDLVSPMWVKDSDFSEDGKFANSLSTSIRYLRISSLQLSER
jgi:hypothetical protein